MKLKELMAKHTPSPEYTGGVTTDAFVLAINITGEEAQPDEYEVVEVFISGVDAQLNPGTEEKQYLRAGKSTTKVTNQRSFAVTGDRYIGDAVQDFMFSHSIKYGVGQEVVVPYVYFCLLDGKGEKGDISIIVNSDGGGTAGAAAAISVDFMKYGAQPEEYTYSASIGG